MRIAKLGQSAEEFKGVKEFKGVRPEWHFRFLHKDLRRQSIFDPRTPMAARARRNFLRRKSV
jgi:hypothetical protein